ncbi:MAG: 50S ribosomal protein L11 methyltransferase [Alphaproteobacteria bacterium]
MWTISVVVPGEAAGLFQLALEPLCVAVAAEIHGPHWRVTGYCEDPPETGGLDAALGVAAAEAGIAPPPMLAELPATDWLAENRKSFPPVRVGRFYIHRTHHDRPPAGGRIAIRLDASLAFGSGTHASTQGVLVALDALARRRRFRRILDLGTGSGILAIAAAKLWPARVVATDIEPNSVRMTRENAAANGVMPRIAAHGRAGPARRAAPSLGHAARFDLVLANIQVRPLTSLAPAIRRRIAPGAHVVLSGLLRADEAEALAAYPRREASCSPRAIRSAIGSRW